MGVQEAGIGQERKWGGHLGDVAVLGLGVSGKAAASYCLSLLGGRVDSLTLYAGPSSEAAERFAQQCREKGARVLFDTEQVEGSFELCIASPGIGQFTDFYQNAQAHSREIVSEVEFAWRESPADARWIGITGTNGKTTTTALLAHLLQSSGLSAVACGNIGDTCLKAVEEHAADIYVAELSSYQLASTVHFAPDVAVLLNITPDHLAWHKSMDAYRAAKGRIFSNMGGHAHAVLDATCDTTRAFVRQLKQEGGLSYVAVGTSDGLSGDMRRACGAENAAFVREDGMLVVAFGGQEWELLPCTELKIPGQHNHSNALHAAAAALCAGAPLEGVRAGLRSFTSLEHRIEACGSVGGVRCYNDSKATNVDATCKALAAFVPERPIVLLGGDDKGTPLDELVATAEQHCRAVVCFGQAGPRFAAAFEASALPSSLAADMSSAVDLALGMADAGDILLLSPACASFDEFDNFEARGRVFKQLVARRMEEREETG